MSSPAKLHNPQTDKRLDQLKDLVKAYREMLKNKHDREKHQIEFLKGKLKAYVAEMEDREAMVERHSKRLYEASSSAARYHILKQ